MNRIERSLRRVDAFQQRHTSLSFVVGVQKKFGDDNAGALVVQLAYSMFTTVFPLLLILVTVLDLVLAGDPAWRLRVLHSSFGEFPIVGRSLSTNLHPLQRSSAFGLVIGLLGLVYGATSLAGSGLFVMAQVWNIPGSARPNYVTRLTRSLAFLALLAVGVVATTLLSGFGSFGRHQVALGIVSDGAALLLNVALSLAAFRLLTPKQVETRQLVPGCVAAGVAWTALQSIGSYVVGHDLKDASVTYGLFGIVLGLLAWLYLGARVVVYAAELNAVPARRLWPRGLLQPPLTRADQESLALEVTQNRRRPEQLVRTEFDVAPETEDQFRSRAGPPGRRGIARSEPTDEEHERRAAMADEPDR